MKSDEGGRGEQEYGAKDGFAPVPSGPKRIAGGSGGPTALRAGHLVVTPERMAAAEAAWMSAGSISEQRTRDEPDQDQGDETTDEPRLP